MANTLDLGRVALDGADLNTLDYLSYDSTNGKIDTTKPIVDPGAVEQAELPRRR